jgi:hypothetical protein
MKIKLDSPKNYLNIEPDMKCAPSKKYIDGSCFSLEAIKNIVNSYNKRNYDQININQTKEQLVSELESRLADECSEQTCWLRLDFVRELENEDILENTFRPKGPSKKYDWLSTTHINDVIKQYQEAYKEFLFLGAVPYDFEDLPFLGIANLNFSELDNNDKYKIGIIINLDEHYKNGSHWVALYTDLRNNQIYFFDSVGKKPQKRIRKFINRITKYLYFKKYNQKLLINDVIENIKKVYNSPNKPIKKKKINKYLQNLINGNFDIKYNSIQHQFENSECGVYSMNFIIRLVEGEPFDSIINNITRDKEMNANRKIYFRNIN